MCLRVALCLRLPLGSRRGRIVEWCSKSAQKLIPIWLKPDNPIANLPGKSFKPQFSKDWDLEKQSFLTEKDAARFDKIRFSISSFWTPSPALCFSCEHTFKFALFYGEIRVECKSDQNSLNKISQIIFSILFIFHCQCENFKIF